MASPYLTFTEVTKAHKTMRGIYVSGGVAVSLLCNSGARSRYPNIISGRQIRYFVGPTTQDVAALDEAVRRRTTVVVYTKHATNRWVRLGDFLAVGSSPPNEDGVRFFDLERVPRAQ